jgi:hypothetical protein
MDSINTKNTKKTKKYSKGKIYKLVNYKTDDIYVGSTLNKLRIRKYQHKTSLKGGNNINLYRKLRNMNVTCNDIELVLIENWPCQNRFELRDREKYWIKKIATLNKAIPNRTIKQYYIDNIVKISNKKKQYYINNIVKITNKKKQKITCICGRTVIYSNIARHKKSKIHNKLMNS